MPEFFFILFIALFALLIYTRLNTLSEDDKPKQPKRRWITRIEDIDGRTYFRGAPPEEWATLEQEYQRQETEKYRRNNR